jgi:virginiamycin B lyase
MAYCPFRRFVTKCGLLAALPLFLETASAQPVVVINEYPVAGSAGMGIGGGPIASGSDGGLWFPVNYGGRFAAYQIFRITTAGVLTLYAPAPPSDNGSVGGITAGPDGALWYTGGNTIWRLTASGAFTSFPLTNANAPPTSIATGPDGALWFTEPVEDVAGSAIGRITTSGVFTQYPIPTVPTEPTGIAAGPDGALWFSASQSGKIGRITTSGTTISEFPVPTLSVYTGITAGPDGALWFVENNAGKIGRITTGGAVTEYPVPMGLPQLIAAGPDGALWFTAGAYIGRITTFGVVTEYPLPTAGFNAFGITAGSDGAMWFTASTGLAFEIGQAVINPNPVPAILSITKTHTANFSQGQTNAVYTLTVLNQQAASPTSGLVTVTDTLPSGLSLISMSGMGWNCTGNSCTRSDAINGGAAYSPITVMVDVAANATSPLVNQASVSGGGSGNASAQDSTIIAIPPLISITKTHTGTFAQGQMNAVYTLTVSNQGGPTNGTVTVTEMPPSGLTVVSMAGSGWTCSGVACTRSDVLNENSSYPAITVTVNVAANAGSPQVNQASVSGGGAAVAAGIADSTIITGSQPPSFFAGEVSLGSGVDFLTFPNNTLFGYYEHLAGSFIYHFDMGFEYVFPANDAYGDVYFWDDQSGHWWYTGPTLFPNLYDFTLGAWIYYFTDPSNSGHYTTNPRQFAFDATHVTFTM